MAIFTKEIFLREFVKLQSFKDKQYEQALKDIFIHIDDLLLSNLNNYDPPLLDGVATFTGCTACVALISKDKIICANAGDSRCVFSRAGKAIELSEDHKPDLASEKARIEKAGGFVEDNRVNRTLNLARSLGDLQYKKNSDVKFDEQMVICVPEIKTETVTRKDEFLIIACDGIWDCLTS